MAAHNFEVSWPTSEDRKTHLEYLEYRDSLIEFKETTVGALKELNEALAEFRN